MIENFNQSEEELIEVNQTIFVDSKFGSDETGNVDQLSNPVKTIEKAIKLITKYRKTKQNRWVISVNPGEYEIESVIPDRVTITGSGLATQISGKINVSFNCEFINFKFIGQSLPCIDVNFESGYENAVALFFGIDLSLSSTLNSKNSEYKYETRTAIQTNSNSLNTTTVFKDCRLDFTLDKIKKGENKLIVNTDGRTEIFMSIINAKVSSSVFNTIVEDIGGIFDMNFGTIIFQPSTNQLKAPCVFFASSSSDPLTVKDIRTIFLPTKINSIPKLSKRRNPDDIPINAVIASLAKENGFIKSRNTVNQWQGISAEQEYIGFVIDIESRVSSLNFTTLNKNAGNIGGSELITQPGQNIKYNVSNEDPSFQSGTTAPIPIIINDPVLIDFFPTIANTIIVVLEASQSFIIVVFGNPTIAGALTQGWTFRVVNRNPDPDAIVRVSLAPDHIFNVVHGKAATFQLLHVGLLIWRIKGVTPISGEG